MLIFMEEEKMYPLKTKQPKRGNSPTNQQQKDNKQLTKLS